MSDAVLSLRTTLQKAERMPVLAALLRTLRSWAGHAGVSPTTRDAAALRQLANRYRETDRGFAADLLSAADRHEEAVRASRPGSAADRRH
jgi:hypothetical protein